MMNLRLANRRRHRLNGIEHGIAVPTVFEVDALASLRAGGFTLAADACPMLGDAVDDWQRPVRHRDDRIVAHADPSAEIRALVALRADRVLADGAPIPQATSSCPSSTALGDRGRRRRQVPVRGRPVGFLELVKRTGDLAIVRSPPSSRSTLPEAAGKSGSPSVSPTT
jgi:hypothetical protein